jgi:hypothetical protein
MNECSNRSIPQLVLMEICTISDTRFFEPPRLIDSPIGIQEWDRVLVVNHQAGIRRELASKQREEEVDDEADNC